MEDMDNNGMKQCPYCAESIKTEAIKCRYCGSNLSDKKINFDFFKTPGYWHRVDEGKKIAGVCTGLAKQFDAPIIIMPLRLFFILTTIFYGFGVILYILLWVLMPSPVKVSNIADVSGAVPKQAPTSEPIEKSEKPEESGDGCFDIEEVTDPEPEKETEDNNIDTDKK
ncbi:PspC domain-containing protein [Candidatus Latescibacterota bacterium]